MCWNKYKESLIRIESDFRLCRAVKGKCGIGKREAIKWVW